ncbi:MAG: hypothetical protein FJW44_02855 [Actinobacteria bacterium]|nr:hypothetical protein [Actinomycetota bacterium]
MNHLLPDVDVVAAYIELRDRFVSLLRTVPEDLGNRIVPHCPAWTVCELASHVVGVPEDIIAGRMDGVASDAWTRAQVERHRGKTLCDLADLMEGLSTQFDPMIQYFPAMARSQMVLDAMSHEHDLRHAVGRPGARDSQAVAVGVSFLREWLSKSPVPDVESLFMFGVQDFDLIRAITGRRSRAQVASLGLPVHIIDALHAQSLFSTPPKSIEE